MNARQACLGSAALLVLAGVIACASAPETEPPATPDPADVIYRGGPILTMEDAQPLAEALAIEQGRIVAIGDAADLAAYEGPGTRIVDLTGRALMPGFVDGHSHLSLTAAKLATVNLDPPPAGPASSIAAIQRSLTERLANVGPGETGWLVGWGYDHAMLAEKRHPTRFDLDAVSQGVPILLIHFSSHQVVLNSRGLELADITAETPDPPGGQIGRVRGSQEPNGILQENAMYGVTFPVLDALLGGAAHPGGPPDTNAMDRLSRAVEHYVANGYTTIGDMAATPLSVRMLRAMADAERLPVDVFAAALTKAYSPAEVAELYSADYRGGFRVGGAKIVLDGGSPGRTAYLREPYHVQLEGEWNYRGFPHYASQADVDDVVTRHLAAGHPIFVHALGDAAVDQAIHALRTARQVVPDRERGAQLIHVQQVQDDQLDALADLEARLTFQVAHNFYFGDFHLREIYGPARTRRLNPARSAIDRGLSVSLHHDSPVHPVDPWMLVWAAVNRTTRSGGVIGPGERITPLEALRGSTIEAARQLHEAADKGSLAVGKRADLIVLDRNPLETEASALNEIRVLETIKDGVSVFSAYGGASDD